MTDIKKPGGITPTGHLPAVDSRIGSFFTRRKNELDSVRRLPIHIQSNFLISLKAYQRHDCCNQTKTLEIIGGYFMETRGRTHTISAGRT